MRPYPNLMKILFLVAIAAALAVAECADAARRTVQSETGFQTVVNQMRSSGGVVTLRAGRYGALAVGERHGRWLTIRAMPGVSVRSLALNRSNRVRIVGLRFRPDGRPALLSVTNSSRVTLDRVRFTAHGTRLSSRLRLRMANRVLIRNSEFTECGESQLGHGQIACVLTGKSSHVTIQDSRFRDCYGCDFVRGHIGRGLTIRRTSFDRAIPGRCGTMWECNHQDGVQIQSGNGILVENSRFGLTVQGAGQLYFSGPIDGLTIRNNVFFGTDATLPDLIGWSAIVIGNHRADEMAVPLAVKILNNTILTGAPRPDGRANSVFLSPSYVNFPVEYRPVVVNNVLGLLREPERLCTLGSTVVANVVRDGGSCVEGGHVGDLGLDERGWPLEGSPVVDAADVAWATITDLRGRVRDATPDIGAFELIR